MTVRSPRIGPPLDEALVRARRVMAREFNALKGIELIDARMNP